MDEHFIRELVEQCKSETKRLLELAVTRRRIHWTHPTFVSFCASIDDILSYQVKWRLRCCSNAATPSITVLKVLSQTCVKAKEVYTKCFQESTEDKEDFTMLSSSRQIEKRVLWVRVALLDGSLPIIVEDLVVHPRVYYKTGSVLCHPEYGQIFQVLLDGPSAIRYSFRYGEIASTVSPSELVDRHRTLLSASLDEDELTGTIMAASGAWEHVQSLHYGSSAGCLYGKNNIAANPGGFSSVLRGYLTLQLAAGELKLKWIPNCLLGQATHSKSGLWDHVMAVNVIEEVSHIHCRKVQGGLTELILIGYDGLALPQLLFPCQSSALSLLECLEMSCSPTSCLYPPLWAVTASHKVVTSPHPWLACLMRCIHCSCWHSTNQCTCTRELGDHWSFAFRLQCGSSPTVVPLAPLATSQSDLTFDSLSVEEEPIVMEASWCFDLQECQLQVSKQFLTRHFYSWLSHSRYMVKVRRSLSHFVSSKHIVASDDVISRESPLSKREWLDFCQLTPSERETTWWRVLTVIYLKGMDHNIRAQVWPFLLGVYPVTSTKQEQETILARATQSHLELMQGWWCAEVTSDTLGYRRSREHSPALTAPTHHCGNTTKLSEPVPDLSKYFPKGGVMPRGHAMSAPMSCGLVPPMSVLDERGRLFSRELENIDKDVPRCDRDYWYFTYPDNLLKLRNIVCSYVWGHLSEGYSQGMCDLLAPLLVIVDNEPLAYACFLKVMERASILFPPSTGLNTHLDNVQTLLRVLDPDYYQYLNEQSNADGTGFFYCYRWFLLCFKREFSYKDVFRIWETTWAARLTVTDHFEEFLTISILRQYQRPFTDARLTPSDILNVFTGKADRQELDCQETLRTAILLVNKLQADLTT